MEVGSARGVIMFHPKLLDHDPLSQSSEGGRLDLVLHELNLEGLWGEQVAEEMMRKSVP